MGEDPNKSEVAKREEETLKFWKENKIFQKSLEKNSGKKEFVFYDGPPFATGLPHTGSLLASVIKDVIPRYKTMRGYYVRRRWGWDTHGLPVENMIEKDLGLKSKKDIELIGIEKFNETCRAKVLMYAHDWQKYVDRIGRWVDFDNSYKTMDASYTESIWWALKQMHEKGLLYEGRKVLMYCPHCETPLAKAEIAMDNSYKDVTEEAVTVKFRVTKSYVLGSNCSNSYLLAWTTTPWTLPANVALAAGPEIEYALVSHPTLSYDKRGRDEVRERYIVASALVEKHFGKEAKIEKTFLGKELVGLEYEPLFDVPKMHSDKSYKVYAADFVSTEEGTGIVHTAVIYGEDDYQLGLKNNLPMVPILNPNGTYNVDAPEFLRGQYIKKADKMVIEDLERPERNLLFAKALNTHSYPHCYRCGTALIYNALSSWFINIQKIKERMIELNEKINWVPEHLKHGRFLNIVENAPDWTISRNRYWASPLPIWKCNECKKVDVVGSLEELSNRITKSGNRYFFMRHGRTARNGTGVISDDPSNTDPVTEEGDLEIRESTNKLKESKIELIVYSPYQRTKQTAQIVASVLGLEKNQMIEDERLGEIRTNMTGKKWSEYWPQFGGRKDRLSVVIEGAENLGSVRRRAMEALFELEAKHVGKNILIVTHEAVTMMTQVGILAEANKMQKAYEDRLPRSFENAEVGELPFWPFPHNANYELDYHRPYIDVIKLKCSCGGIMTRIPEVVDCWVESGSMPFAEYHYPFENKTEFEKRFPGDFIAEYIAQTRTWFYYMLAISTALFDQESFKNVVTTGNILAADSSKMSKSKKNYTDPLIIMDQYGADALRHTLMISVVMQGEDVNFRDDEVKEVYQRLVNILWNSVQFYALYSQNHNSQFAIHNSKNILDRWILARLGELHHEVTENLDKFDTVKAGRPIRNFVDDLSTWYIRRSRDRFKSENEKDKESAIETTRFVLLELSKLIAPFMPFLAEQVYKAVGGEFESVHLENWPEIKSDNEHSDILQNMRITREIVSLALEARQKAGIKVRQPLQSLQINQKLNQEYLELIKDEVNVKEVMSGTQIKLDTNITPELKLEGEMRDLVRAVQEKRKDLGLQPGDMISITLPTSLSGLAAKYESEIKKAVHAEKIEVAEIEEIKIEKI